MRPAGGFIGSVADAPRRRAASIASERDREVALRRPECFCYNRARATGGAEEPRLARARSNPRATASLVYALAAFAILAVAWNGLASRFGAQEHAMRRNGDVFERASKNLALTMDTLPAPALPRIAVLGSSQIAVVKTTNPDPVLGTPHQLKIALDERGTGVEVVDLSDGGQQAVESLLVWQALHTKLRADAVVIGMSLFSMLRPDVRPTLLAGIDATGLRNELRALLSPSADPQSVDSLLAWGSTAAQRVSARGITIQERLDEAIGDWLAAHVASFANRQAMFDALLDQPIRRDLASLVTRRIEQLSTARTYEIGGAFPVALLAIEVLARATARDGVPLLVALLPYDDQRPPVPFSNETQTQVREALEARAQQAGFELLDLSHLLPSERFGSFVDGSPDNLHFDPLGHTAVATRIADALLPIFRAKRTSAN
jgi:hypothetical protein